MRERLSFLREVVGGAEFAQLETNDWLWTRLQVLGLLTGRRGSDRRRMEVSFVTERNLLGNKKKN